MVAWARGEIWGETDGTAKGHEVSFWSNKNVRKSIDPLLSPQSLHLFLQPGTQKKYEKWLIERISGRN